MRTVSVVTANTPETLEGGEQENRELPLRLLQRLPAGILVYLQSGMKIKAGYMELARHRWRTSAV